MKVEHAKRHEPTFVGRQEAHLRIHGGSVAGRLNARLAVRITNGVGSMWCAYLFAALALVSLPSALRSGDTVVMVSWVSQTFLQLVLLSVIIVGQNVQAAATEGRAEADHETLAAVHALSVAIHELSEQQSEILRRLDARGA